MSIADVYAHTIGELLSPIGNHLRDPSVSEVLINGPSEIYVERAGKLTRVPERFSSTENLTAAITAIAQYAGRFVGPREPILEARLPDGSRVEAVLPPACRVGPSLAIRRFSKETLTVAKLIQFGALTQDAADALSLLVEFKQNVLVAGGTGSGKTSLLNALSSFIPSDERVVVIEDASELQLQRSHVVQLEAQQADAKGRGRVSIGDLFRATLRMRPDRIVVGEIRGGEALDLIQAMSSGHGGCMSTLHATYPMDALHRLETMALMSSVELPFAALRAQIASAVDVIVQVGRMRDGSRRVTHIVDVAHGPEGYTLTPLFVTRSVGSREAPARVELVATGEMPRCAQHVNDAGRVFPQSMREPQS